MAPIETSRRCLAAASRHDSEDMAPMFFRIIEIAFARTWCSALMPACGLAACCSPRNATAHGRGNRTPIRCYRPIAIWLHCFSRSPPARVESRRIAAIATVGRHAVTSLWLVQLALPRVRILPPATRARFLRFSHCLLSHCSAAFAFDRSWWGGFAVPSCAIQGI